MPGQELPRRAKPEALHQVSRYLRKEGPIEKTQLYDEMEVDRRQIRAAIDYGVKLGFIALEDETVSITENGRVLGYSGDLDESSVREVFQDAIRAYEPYRMAFLWIQSEDLIEEVNGDPCIKQSTLSSAIEKTLDIEPSRREINLLIKTAAAAGLGEFITGRKGLETRLKASQETQPFMQKLIEDYGIPESLRAGTKSGTDDDGANEDSNDAAPANVPTLDDPEEITIKAEWDISDKTDEEIAALIRQIRALGVDSIA